MSARVIVREAVGLRVMVAVSSGVFVLGGGGANLRTHTASAFALMLPQGGAKATKGEQWSPSMHSDAAVMFSPTGDGLP